MQDPVWNVDEHDHGKAWGLARQPQMALSLRFVNGNRRFFAYNDLAGGAYLGDVIRLHFYHATVTMRGKGLQELADHLERQTVRFIREQHVAPFEVEGTAFFIERIEVGPANLEALSLKRTG